jgi:cell division protein FtsI/penicillin-binding protein 2
MKRTRMSLTPRFVTCFGLLPFLASILLYTGPCIGQAAGLQESVEKEFLNSGNAVLVINPQTGHVLASLHQEIFLEQKYPPGSLVKPFSLIAFYRQHGNSFPILNCPATLANDPAGCWNRNGHGKVSATEAIADSCNVYFRQLSTRISPDIFARTLAEYEVIDDPSEIMKLPEETLRKIMVGNTNDWIVSPYRILRAYCELWNGGYVWRKDSNILAESPLLSQPLRTVLHDGMLLSSVEGTSLEASRISGTKLLGKTGTSLRYSNGLTDRNSTQGWWIGLYPVEHPRIAIMTFVSGGRGATDAAPLGGKILAMYLNLNKLTNEK